MSDDTKTNPRTWILPAVLCVIALIGYALPAINVHFSALDQTHTFGFGLKNIINKSESLPEEFAFTEDADLSEIFSEISIIDILNDAVRTAVFSAASYIAVLILLLVFLVFALLAKFKLLKTIIVAFSLVLFITAGLVILTVPEIVIDILTDFMGDELNFILSSVDISDFFSLELGFGYWLTLSAVIVMTLIETINLIRTKKT